MTNSEYRRTGKDYNISRPTPTTLELMFDGCQVTTLEELIKFCLIQPEVIALNPGSDYTSQYYTIEVFAEAVCVIFRKEDEG